MNTLNFLDANVWLALLWSRHAHSERARLWFESAAEERFFFCRFTQLTVLRLLTTEQVMGSDACGMARAWDLWDRIWADDRILFLPEPNGLEQEFRVHSRLASRSPKVWADAYLLAFASVSGMKLVSFDRALAGRKVEVLIL
jgi:toxin-antitoxin system PIN domain toxin